MRSVPFLDAFARTLDARVNLKHVHRRLELVARAMIVTTFIEDALRCLFGFSGQRQSMAIAGWRGASTQMALPLLSVLVQLGGALCVLIPATSRARPLVGCALLICWSAFHPFMYGQYANAEFVLETVTIVGGLLILASHLLLGPATSVLPHASASAISDAGDRDLHASWFSAAGRVMITAIFIYYAFLQATDARIPPIAPSPACPAPRAVPPRAVPPRARLDAPRATWQVHSFANRLWTASPFSFGMRSMLFEASLCSALVYMCSLVVIGMKSRWCALLLAATTLVSASYMHPWWLVMFTHRTCAPDDSR